MCNEKNPATYSEGKQRKIHQTTLLMDLPLPWWKRFIGIWVRPSCICCWSPCRSSWCRCSWCTQLQSWFETAIWNFEKKKSFHFWPTTLAQDSEIFTIQEVDNGMTSQNGLGSSHTPITIKICFFSKKKFLWFCFFSRGQKSLGFPLTLH